MLTVAFETHGCKLNQADSQALAKEFSESGFSQVDNAANADVFVLNTCTVTHVADKKGRQAARAAKRMNPSTFVVVTGCYAQRDRNQLEAITEIDMVLGNSDKKDIVSKVFDRIKVLYAWEDAKVNQPLPVNFDYQFVGKNLNRRMIKIQEGCDQICSYCIVPKVRGRERSIPVNDLISNINDASTQGVREVVLTGTQLGSYGFDLGNSSLSDMVKQLLDECEIERIRISSIQPQEFSDELLDLWQDDRLCPHFHIPLQSGSNKILKNMRRRYSREEYLDSIQKVRSMVPEASITTDVIVGYPDESDHDFEFTMEICDKIKFSDVHVFRYSSRPGTTAYYLQDSVDSNIKSERSKKLIYLAQQCSMEHKRHNVGNQAMVLWEKTMSDTRDEANLYSGLTENYLRVQCQSKYDLVGEITPVVITSYEDSTNKLKAELI